MVVFAFSPGCVFGLLPLPRAPHSSTLSDYIRFTSRHMSVPCVIERGDHSAVAQLDSSFISHGVVFLRMTPSGDVSYEEGPSHNHTYVCNRISLYATPQAIRKQRSRMRDRTDRSATHFLWRRLFQSVLQPV